LSDWTQCVDILNESLILGLVQWMIFLKVKGGLLFNSAVFESERQKVVQFSCTADNALSRNGFSIGRGGATILKRRG